ncbi:hypothetical protein WMY93_031005 [Mugilogobius chulae]|uniref:Uncharacterized protein n=1 Tax=Mugilogobius chulae TaxID=88201 RepID=A0AAW0MF28_9GOBI
MASHTSSNCLRRVRLWQRLYITKAFQKKKKTSKGDQGFSVLWRKRDIEGNLIPQHQRSSQPGCSQPSQTPPRDLHLHNEGIVEEAPSLEEHLHDLRELLDSIPLLSLLLPPPLPLKWRPRGLRDRQFLDRNLKLLCQTF